MPCAPRATILLCSGTFMGHAVAPSCSAPGPGSISCATGASWADLSSWSSRLRNLSRSSITCFRATRMPRSCTAASSRSSRRCFSSLARAQEAASHSPTCSWSRLIRCACRSHCLAPTRTLNASALQAQALLVVRGTHGSATTICS